MDMTLSYAPIFPSHGLCEEIGRRRGREGIRVSGDASGGGIDAIHRICRPAGAALNSRAKMDETERLADGRHV